MTKVNQFPHSQDPELMRASKAGADHLAAAILQFVAPRSAIDLGCGLGTILSVFREKGIQDVFGVDQPPPDERMLQIPKELFQAYDLNQPYRTGRRFDLVTSFEVAEHLKPSSAEAFVDTLTRLGSVVVFSAAIPKQGGLYHVNEQWQDWWARLFEARGYRAIDCIRDVIWNDRAIANFLRQNTLMYATDEAIEANPKLKAAYERTQRGSLDRVHPEFYMWKLEPSELGTHFLLEAIPQLPRALYRSMKVRLSR